jgi:MFS family permease
MLLVHMNIQDVHNDFHKPNYAIAFQLLYSKFYTFFNVKLVFLIALVIFETGSVICGAALTSSTFIVGRAIAGLGAAGLFTGATTAVVQVVPIAVRPIIVGLLGALFGINSILGPLVSSSSIGYQ